MNNRTRRREGFRLPSRSTKRYYRLRKEAYSSRERRMRKKERKKKKINIANLLLISVFFVGLLVVLYPTISDFFNEFHASRAIINYEEAVSEMSDEEYNQILKKAKNYNKNLISGDFVNGKAEDKLYQSLLNIGGDGIMGYIEIQKLGVDLPIYHGTSEEILQTSVGHLEGSSLPVGGKGTHSVLTGHRGLPTAKLFTDLDQLQEGDTFQIFILDEVLTYEVDKISIVEPEDVSKLMPVKGKDYVTLVTCTPYAVNTHRLLVRGVRIPTPYSAERVSADAILIEPMLVVPVIAVPALSIVLTTLLISTRKKRKHNNIVIQKKGVGEESCSEKEEK